MANPIDTIRINAKGNYSYHTLWFDKQLMNSGTWHYDSSNCRIVFADFSFLTDTMEFLNGPGHGFWSPQIRKKKNEIQLVYATDIQKGYYLKID